MRIVIDARISRRWSTGVGRYTLELASGMAQRGHEITLLGHPGAPVPPTHIGARVIKVPIAVASAGQHLRLPGAIARLGADVVLATHPLAAMLASPMPRVSCVLDVYPLRLPDQFPRSVWFYYRSVATVAIRRSHAIVAISSATREDLCRRMGVAPERVDVIPLAASAHLVPVPPTPSRAATLRRYGLDRPFFLYHGNKRPHKNVPGLMRAYAALDVREPMLAITGDEDPLERELDTRSVRALAADLGIDGRVVFTGRIAEEDLAAVYSGAVATVIPSMVEGFGLPALESLACGTPVVASRSGALPEVTGDAGLLVPPGDDEALRDALSLLIGDRVLRETLAGRAVARASSFSWDRTVAETLAVLSAAKNEA